MYVHTHMDIHACVHINVTVFEKSQLPCTQQQDTLHHQMKAVHTNQQFRQVLMLKVPQATSAVACF